MSTDQGYVSVPAIAGVDKLPGGLEWLREQIDGAMSDFHELVAELNGACRTDSLEFPLSLAELEEGIIAIPEDPATVLEKDGLRSSLIAMNFFCQNNQRKISSWEATGKIRATLKSAMMKAGCCLTRGAVEELVELQADLDELSPTRRDALRTVISDIEFELPRFLTFVGSKGAESVTRFASEPLTKYRQLFRANGDISPLGNRCLFLLAQVRESSRLAIDLVKRSPNPNASGHAKGKAIRCCKKAIRDV